MYSEGLPPRKTFKVLEIEEHVSLCTKVYSSATPNVRVSGHTVLTAKVTLVDTVDLGDL